MFFCQKYRHLQTHEIEVRVIHIEYTTEIEQALPRITASFYHKDKFSSGYFNIKKFITQIESELLGHPLWMVQFKQRWTENDRHWE